MDSLFLVINGGQDDHEMDFVGIYLFNICICVYHFEC